MKIAFLTTDNREQFNDYENPTPHFGPAPTALLDGLAMLPEDVEVHVISCTRRKMDSPRKLAENIWFHQPLVPHLGWGRSAFAGCGWATRRAIQELHPDLIHAQGTERDCAVSMMMGPRLPKILTIHGHMARIAEVLNAKPLSYYWLVRHLEALAIPRADGVVAITRYTQDRLSDRARRTWVVPNAVEPSFFEVNSPGTGNLVLCVASLSPWKRQVELIRAIDGIPEGKRPRVVLLGVGAEAEYGREVLDLIKERQWCEHPGAVGREELKNWLRKAGLLILPSTEDNCPMVILEAMAAGVPVAASNIGGIPDLIENGVNGRLFDPRDLDSIRDAIIQWHDDPAKTAEMARTAKSMARERFHPKAIAEEHLRIYQEVLSKHGN